MGLAIRYQADTRALNAMVEDFFAETMFFLFKQWPSVPDLRPRGCFEEI